MLKAVILIGGPQKGEELASDLCLLRCPNHCFLWQGSL
uniref:GDP-mannose pyrophosphorylase A n=1 Tax=Homo sapiens TaxID=9606 RepID=A0A804HLK2_HUMAN